jgi:glycogen debranching enzyme
VEAAGAGLRFLLEQRGRHDSGLVLLCHPWESGADDSPRWDDCCPGGFDTERWRTEKNRLVTTIRFAGDGSPLRNPAFPVASVGFNALVAFNAGELASVTGDDGLAAAADVLAGALDARWDDDLGTWVDAGSTAEGSGRCRTADALLPLLVTEDPARAARVVADLLDPAAHGGPSGPTGVHRAEPVFDPVAYWRGPVWPQLAYLLVLGAARFDADAAAQLAAATVAGAWASGLAEYWHPDTGAGLGATPQSWTGLALVLAERS